MLFLLATSLLPLFQQASADLGAAVRRSNPRDHTVLPAAAPLSSPLVIPLTRSQARGGERGQVSLYTSDVIVGQPPQVLRVTFDTSSGHLLLPHRACMNASCLAHQRYSPWESSTAMDINSNGGLVEGVHGRLARGRHVRDVATLSFTQSDLGEGEVKGVFVRDGVCVAGMGGKACVDMAVLAAVSMDDTPFLGMPSDGIIGLGLQSLSSGPMSSFLGRLFEGSVGVLKQFGIALSGKKGELHLGGHDSARLAAPLRWFPVHHPSQGFWQVAIRAVRVGNTTVDDCHQGCHGVIDTGVSRLGVQASKLQALKKALSMASRGTGRCNGPALSFDLGGMTLTLGEQDYAGTDCSPLIGSLDLPEPEFVGVYALGGALLQRYYTAFDWEQHRLGFAPLKDGSSGSTRVRSQLVPKEPEGVLMVF